MGLVIVLPLLDTFLKWSSVPVNKLEKRPSSLSHHLGVEVGLLSQLMWEIVHTSNLLLSAYRGEKYYINMVWVVRMKVYICVHCLHAPKPPAEKFIIVEKHVLFTVHINTLNQKNSSFKSWTVIKGIVSSVFITQYVYAVYHHQQASIFTSS